MKKLIASLFAATLLGSGLAAVQPGTAQAAPPGYEDTVRTVCGAFAVGKPNNKSRTKIKARASAPGSTDSPRGFLNVTVRKFNGADGGSARFFTRGGSAILKFGPLRPGRYTGSLFYEARPLNSKFQDCTDGFFFRVRRNR